MAPRIYPWSGENLEFESALDYCERKLDEIEARIRRNDSLWADNPRAALYEHRLIRRCARRVETRLAAIGAAMAARLAA